MNILAAVAMAGVAYMGLVHGLYRSLQTLVACVLAGAVALGLFGPATALFPAENPKSIWYFAADPFCLWAIFCCTFLLLRTLAEKLLGNEPALPALVDRAGGLVFGAATGYLAVGICVLLVQMLPTSPSLLGYEAFRYRRGEEGWPDAIEPGGRLWLAWDRGTLAFFGYLLSQPLGSEDSALVARYGDLYPPPEVRGEGYAGTVDADDVLYYYWYRRYEFILWQTGVAEGPVPEPVRVSSGGPGAALGIGQAATQADVSVRIVRLERTAALPGFPQEKPQAGQEFFAITVRFRPTGRLPRTVDSSQFFLLGTRGERYYGPLILGRAKAGQPEPQPLADYPVASASTFRAPQFSMPAGKQEGQFLARGGEFVFTESKQEEVRTFVFAVPKEMPNDLLRLNVLAAPPAEQAAPAARPGPGPAPVKSVPPAKSSPSAGAGPASPVAQPAKSGSPAAELPAGKAGPPAAEKAATPPAPAK